MATDTYLVSANLTTATQIVWADSGPHLIINTSLTATIFVGNSNTLRVTDGNGIIPIGPNGSLVVDGTRDFFAVTASVTPVTIATVAGGISTFSGLTGGGGNLVLPSMQSPNFVPGVSGWRVGKDGSAQFNSITVPPGSGGATIFVQGVAPVANNIDDVWINTSNNNQVLTWSGSAWVAQKFGTAAIANGSITAALIAANTITAGQLAAGIIYAGIINGTTVNAATFMGSTFNGTDFIINANGIWMYNGTPSALNPPIISIINPSGTATDPFGNTSPFGISMQYPVYLGPYSSTPSAIAGVATLYSQNGDLQIVDGSDSQTYVAARRTIVLGADTTINSTTQVTALSTALSGANSANRSYRFYAKFNIVPNAAAGGMASVVLCPSNMTPAILNERWTDVVTATRAIAGESLFLGMSLGIAANPGFTQTAGHIYTVEYDGVLTIPSGTATTLSFQFACNTGDPYILKNGSYIEVGPV